MIGLLLMLKPTPVHGNYVIAACAMLVAAAGVGSLAGWASRHKRAAAVLVGIVIVSIVATLAAQAVCCTECDPWWAQFWICVPAA